MAESGPDLISIHAIRVVPHRDIYCPCNRPPNEENSMMQLPWILAAILGMTVIEIVAAFVLQFARPSD